MYEWWLCESMHMFIYMCQRLCETLLLLFWVKYGQRKIQLHHEWQTVNERDKSRGTYESEWCCAYGNIWRSPRSVQWSGRGWHRVRWEACGASRRGHIRILCQLSTYNEATAPQANWWFPPQEDQCCYTHLTKRERECKENGEINVGHAQTKDIAKNNTKKLKLL